MGVLGLAVGKKKSVRVEFKAEPDWVARLEAQAERLGLDESAYIRMAVSERMERDEATDPRQPTPPKGK